MCALATQGRTGNGLLDRLPEDEYGRLARSLEPASLAVQQELYPADQPTPYVYFPRSGVISVVILMEDGQKAEAVTIGNEGMAGLAIVLGVGFGRNQVTCRVAGESLRLPAGLVPQALRGNPRLDVLVKHYAAYSLRSAKQLVACNALHPVEERLCRWLLMTHDRAGADSFPLTQEFMAEMLGVRRQTVTVIARTLQAAELISYRRGVIRIVNRQGLEEAASECSAAMKALYARALQ
jgi:CRP-like cAMP-binding protein